MKKTLTLLMIVLLGGTLLAQGSPDAHRKHHRRAEPPKIEEMVSDLSAVQKKKLESITQDCKTKTDKLRADLQTIRTKIRALMDKEGDQSDKLFPLFDREAALQAEISKEMYSTRQKIDQVLTAEQLAQFRACCKADRKKPQPPADPPKGPKQRR